VVGGPGGVVLASTAGLSLSSLQINSAVGPASLQLAGVAYSVGSLANSGTGAVSVILGNSAAGTATTLTLGGDNSSSTFGGAIGDLLAVNRAAIGSLVKMGSGTLVLSGSSNYSGPTVISGGTLRLYGFIPGLYEGMVSTNTATFDTADAIPHTSVQLWARWGDSKTSGGNNVYPAWGDDTTWGYTGYFYNPSSRNVSYEFGKNFDDNGYLNIDGTTLIDDTTWTNHPTATMTLTPGWHAIDLRFGQGGGGVGPIDGTFGGHGMAFSTNGGATWSAFADPGNGSLLAAQLGGNNLLPATTVMNISAGSTLDLGGGSQQLAVLADYSPGVGGNVINGNSASASVLTLSPTGGSSTFSGQILGGGALGTLSLVMSGNGTQVLCGTNTYTGGTTISGGVLQMGNALALGSPTNSLTTTGGTLDLNNYGLTVRSLAGYSGTILSNSGTASVLTVNQASGASTYGGTLADGMGRLGLTKIGSGTLVLSGSNRYSGPTVISSGTVRLNGSVAGFGGNGSGWTLTDSTGGYPVRVAGNLATLTTQSGYEANALWYDTPLPVAGGPWTARFTYTNVSGGGADGGAFVIQTNGLHALGNAGGSKGLNGTNGSYAPITRSAEIVWELYSGSGGSEINYTTDGNATTSTATGNGVSVDETTPVNFTLSYDGTSKLSLTAVQSGNTWTQSYNAALGSTLNNPANGLAYIGFTGGTGGENALQQLSNFSFTSYYSFNNVLPAASPVQVAGGALLDINGGTQTIGSLSGAGTVTNSNERVAANLIVGGDNTSQTFSGAITATVPANLALTKIGSGTQTLSGENNYTGGTTVDAGTLALGAAASLPGNTAVTVSGTLDLVTFGGNVSLLNGSGTVDHSGQGSSTLTVGSGDFTGAIENSGGSLGLLKVGNGELILSGSNTYSGGTDVAAGTLGVTNPAALPNETNLTVDAGGTFIFDPSAAADPVLAHRAAVPVSAADLVGAVPVPEPSTVALLAAGVMVAAGGAVRRKTAGRPGR
jgi:autotransporter-associated beta strand protein